MPIFRFVHAGYTGKLSSKYRIGTAIRTDERVRFMDEIISGIQIIKLYAWEKPFAALISMARKMELKIVRKNSHIRALYMTFAMFTTRMALFCSLLSIVLLYGEENITAAKVFVVSSYFSVVAQTMTQMFVRGVAEIAEGLVAFERIQNFLENEEKMTLAGNQSSAPQTKAHDSDNNNQDTMRPDTGAGDTNTVASNVSANDEDKHNEVTQMTFHWANALILCHIQSAIRSIFAVCLTSEACCAPGWQRKREWCARDAQCERPVDTIGRGDLRFIEYQLGFS